MATTTKKTQIIQKTSETDLLLLHPETDADVILYDNSTSQLNADNAQDAIDEVVEQIKSITGGGTVTGVKGEAESTFRTGQVNITKSNIGLGNVNNTSDMDKPVSTAQQEAINAVKEDAAGKYIPISQKGAASGVATLGTDGKVPSAQLPGFVDDVREYNNLAGFPATGESGVIYVAKDTNKTYRWSGTGYVEISESVALGETSSTAYPGDKGKANADAIAALQNGTTAAGAALKLQTARTISVAGDATGSTTFDGSSNVTINTTLKNSGVTAGTYSAVAVNAKGIVTAGAQVIEVGTAGQTQPSANLAAGGLFFQLL